MQEKRTLYLAGKITGDPYYFTKFYNAQKKLEEGGFIVVNPALLPAEGFTWEAYMRMSGAMLAECADVCFLPDWKESKGAKYEFGEAMAQNNAAPLARLIEQFERLPGIGRKNAQRLAYHILSMTDEQAKEFADTIVEAKTKIHRCPVCCDLTDAELCPICKSPSRDKSVICVVEDPKAVMAIERTHEFGGVYHVLHGLISPMNGVGPDDLCIKELVNRLGDGEVKELIMATNPTAEGDVTALFISRLVKPLGVKVSRLAYGIPVGADLEYADNFTLTKAIEGRKEL